MPAGPPQNGQSFNLILMDNASGCYCLHDVSLQQSARI